MMEGRQAGEHESLKDQELLFEYFARSLVHQLRADGYPDKWAAPPLDMLLDSYLDLLNTKGRGLGQIISGALEKTEGALRAGNINQLGLRHPDVFADTEQHALDDFRARTTGPSTDSDPSSDVRLDPESRELLVRITHLTLEVYSELQPTDHDAHRTLDATTISLTPLFTLAGSETQELGQSLVEYRDYWRPMNRSERADFKARVLAGSTSAPRSLRSQGDGVKSSSPRRQA